MLYAREDAVDSCLICDVRTLACSDTISGANDSNNQERYQNYTSTFGCPCELLGTIFIRGLQCAESRGSSETFKNTRIIVRSCETRRCTYLSFLVKVVGYSSGRIKKDARCKGPLEEGFIGIIIVRKVSSNEEK